MKKDISSLKPSREGFITNYPYVRHWEKINPEKICNIRPINLYLHIPFCIQQCSYCYYKKIFLKKGGSINELSRYVKTLCHEIETASKYFDLKKRPVVSIYLGGGTPTIMKEEHFNSILETLHNNFNIKNPEFTVEAEPLTLTKKKADFLKKIKVNRISLGVQSLQNQIIKLCNRLDKAEQALKAIAVAKESGAVVNIDLLSGLADETMETWSDTIQKALSTEVESITVYKMEVYPNTEYYKKIRNESIKLPSEKDELEFMSYALKKFNETDYKPWSFFAFTKKGEYEHKYITSVWNKNDCYGFGLSAFGEIGNWLFQNTNDMEKYLSITEAGHLPINRGIKMSSRDQMIRSVILGMKLIKLNLKKFQNMYGFSLESLCKSAIEELSAESFIKLSGDYIEMTEKGILYGDYVGKRLSIDIEKIYKDYSKNNK